MPRTLSLLAVLALAACSRPQVASPRYAVDLFSEDTLQAHVTVVVNSPTMEASLSGAGFYTRNKVQPVVLTPASLVIRGTGSVTISAVDSMHLISLVPAGTHPDSTEAVTTVGRIFRVTRAEGQRTFKLEVARP